MLRLSIIKKEPIIISVVGTLVEKTSKQLTIDWYGGSNLIVLRSLADGDWDQLLIGDWLEATVSRSNSGEVIGAILLGKIKEPAKFSENELRNSYNSIPSADLDVVN